MALKTKLGPLCKRGHEHGNTGQSLRHATQNYCIECDRVVQARYRERKRALQAGKAPSSRVKAAKALAPTAKPAAQKPKPRAITAAHRRALAEVIKDVARKFARRFNVDQGDLVQEGWMYAMGAYQDYWRKCPDQSDDGLRGWVFRVIYPRIAMYTWKATTPVSFPKKAVPAKIREGMVAVPPEKAPPRAAADLELEFGEAEKRAAVDKAMGRVLERYPLATMCLKQALPATEVARIMGQPDLVTEVRRQTSAAKTALKIALRRTIQEHTP